MSIIRDMYYRIVWGSHSTVRARHLSLLALRSDHVAVPPYHPQRWRVRRALRLMYPRSRFIPCFVLRWAMHTELRAMVALDA